MSMELPELKCKEKKINEKDWKESKNCGGNYKSCSIHIISQGEEKETETEKNI